MMTSDYLLGIDIGTYESKGVLTDPAGNIVGQAACAHGLEMPKPGWAEHDADKVWWQDFCFLVKRLVDQTGIPSSSVAAVGCSGIGPDLLPIDENGQPLRPAILYGIDTRATAEIAELESRFGSDRITQVCGNSLSSQSVGPKILWLARHEPEIFRRTRHILTATGYLVQRLTGRACIDYYTAVTFAPLFNINTLAWDKDMCAGVVNPDFLPTPAWSAEVAGAITPEAASITGLRSGTPVIVGTTDAAAEAISVGVVWPGELMIMYGSTLFLIHVTDHLVVNPRLWTGVYLFSGRWALSAGMATSGSITRWFRDEFSASEKKAEAEGGLNAYAALASAAAQVPPGSQGLMVLPYFSGERTPVNDPLARGVIAGLTIAHSRKHVYRAILEGVAYGLAHNLEVIHETGATTTRAVAVGGGTKNELWLQMVSDVTGIEQFVPAQTIGAAYGDAFLAGLGIGMLGKPDEIKSWVKPSRVIKPDPAARDVYASYYREYRRLYPILKEQMHTLAHLGEGGGV
jgi:xylulokinase